MKKARMKAADMSTERYLGNGEPTLREMMDDPTFLAVLRRDGWTPAALWRELGPPPL
jgi:hypothetical protein